MVARLRLSNGGKLFTELDLGDDKRAPLEVLKDILEANPTGWLGCLPNSALTGSVRLVNVAHIVVAELA